MTRRSIRVAAVCAAVALLLGVAVYVQIEKEQLTLTTGLLLIGAVATASLALTEIALSLISAVRVTHVHVRTSIVTTSVLLVGLELVLRFGLGTYTTYLETNEGAGYRPLYHHTSPTWFHVYNPNGEVTHSRPEFAYPRKINSLGLAEREIPEKEPNEYRIIALGDSYTEGVGAAYDETWVKMTERRLASPTAARAVVALNAGISGSDPWHEYMLLKKKLLPYKPDLVVVAINTTDIGDVMIRGGSERFQSDGTTRIRNPPPPWEWLYGISYLFRHLIHDVLHYDYLFIRESALEAAQQKAIDHVVDAVRFFVALGDESGFHLLIVVHPDHWEAVHQKYGDSFARAVDKLTRLPNVDVLDVLERWKSAGLLDADGASALYWKIDGHLNSKGYAAFGETVADGILHAGLISGE